MKQFIGVHRDARAIIQSLPILAAVMAEDIGVTVRFAQKVHTGMTDGKIIVLPTVPLPTKSATPEELQKLATYYFGLEDHEIGHCRVSDLPSITTRLLQETPLVHSLFNVIEDPRMENEHGLDYPGADRNMRKLSVQLVNDQQDNPIRPETPVDVAIASWMCHYLRFAVRNEDCYRLHAEQGEQVLISAIGENAVSRIKGYLAKAPTLKSSLDSFNLSKQIVLAIEEESKREPPAEVPDEGQQKQNSEPEEKTGSSSSPDEEESHDGDASCEPTMPPEQTEEQTEALKSVVATTQIQPDRGDAVREILSADIEEIIEQGHAVSGESVNVPASNIVEGTSQTLRFDGVIDTETVRGVSARARTRLASLLQTETREVSRLSKRGKHIDARQLHRLRIGDSRIFLSVQDSRSLDTALFLLLDVSGSMNGGQIEIAREAMLATAIATDMLKGVSLATGTFPGYHMIQPFGTKARMAADRYAVAANGSSTPLAEGMLWAGKHLAKRREARKVLIVATDGIPDSIPAAQAAGVILGATQVDVIGYGISVDISEVIPRSQTLMHVNELPAALMAMLQDVLSLSLAA